MYHPSDLSGLQGGPKHPAFFYVIFFSLIICCLSIILLPHFLSNLLTGLLSWNVKWQLRDPILCSRSVSRQSKVRGGWKTSSWKLIGSFTGPACFLQQTNHPPDITVTTRHPGSLPPILSKMFCCCFLVPS